MHNICVLGFSTFTFALRNSPKARVDFLCLDVCHPLWQIYSSKPRGQSLMDKLQKEVYDQNCTRTTFTSWNAGWGGYNWAFVDRKAPIDTYYQLKPLRRGSWGLVDLAQSIMSWLSVCLSVFCFPLPAPIVHTGYHIIACQYTSLGRGLFTGAAFTTPSHPPTHKGRSKGHPHPITCCFSTDIHSMTSNPTAWPLTPQHTTCGKATDLHRQTRIYFMARCFQDIWRRWLAVKLQVMTLLLTCVIGLRRVLQLLCFVFFHKPFLIDLFPSIQHDKWTNRLHCATWKVRTVQVIPVYVNGLFL